MPKKPTVTVRTDRPELIAHYKFPLDRFQVEAMDVLDWVMCIALYHPGSMAIEIVVDLPAFFLIVDSIVTHNHS